MKLTQKDIGDRLKIAASTISVYERGGEGLSDFVIQAIRGFYDRLPNELGLDENEKRYLRIAENAVCLFEEKAPGFRVKYASSVIIDCGHAINEETKPKFVNNDKSKPKPFVMK